MYPESERVAREEGINEIADFCQEAAEAEQEPEKPHLTLHKSQKEGEVLKKGKTTKWRCPDCPYVSEGTDAPDECPGLCV